TEAEALALLHDGKKSSATTARKKADQDAAAVKEAERKARTLARAVELQWQRVAAVREDAVAAVVEAGSAAHAEAVRHIAAAARELVAATADEYAIREAVRQATGGHVGPLPVLGWSSGENLTWSSQRSHQGILR